MWIENEKKERNVDIKDIFTSISIETIVYT